MSVRPSVVVHISHTSTTWQIGPKLQE